MVVMNCIFCCVFYQKKYVDMFFLLLESIIICEHLDNNTDVLVYTSTSFMNMIKQHHLYNHEKIKFEINDTFNTIDKACKARLDLFKLSSIKNYTRILYLDTDVIVKDDIDKMFRVCNDDVLYCLEEGTIEHDYWGKTLFGDEIHNYHDTPAFTSGILLFNNCEKIKDLFDEINQDIINRPHQFECHDQPYIVYNAFKHRLYNNTLLKTLVVNNDYNVQSDKVIHHFPGGPGVYQHKMDAMTIFLNEFKLYKYSFNNTLHIENAIPKVLFQTNRGDCEHDYVSKMIKSMLTSEWKYEFYNDSAVIKFFIDNPIAQLPNIIQKYNSIQKGAHRADLFRYYYLYVNGGFFMDSDAMLYVNIDTIVKDYNFVSVNSSCHPGTIFQGILGASPKNKIIEKALFQAYTTSQSALDNEYHYFCRQLYNIIKENHFDYNIKLYEEVRKGDFDDILDGNTLLFRHYWKHKVIPYAKVTPCANACELIKSTDWNNYDRSELHMFDYRVLTTYMIPNNMVRVGPANDGGYVIVDGFDYDLFISCGIATDIRFEDCFLDINKIKCIAFDGTISSFPSHRNSIDWIPKNIGHLNNEKTTNLKEYMQGSKKIFLKMDIEGSEFNWIDSMTEAELDNISQMILEVHWPFDIYRMNMLEKLNKTHYITHIHGNNYCAKDIPTHLPCGRTYDGTVTI